MKSRDLKQLACGYTVCYLQNGDQNLALLPPLTPFPELLHEVRCMWNITWHIMYPRVHAYQFISIHLQAALRLSAVMGGGKYSEILSSGRTYTN